MALLALAVLAAGGFGLYRLGEASGAKGSTSSAPANTNAGSDKKVLYWHDPMSPGQKFDKPGKSPFMDMQLVPVYAGEAGDESKVSISARVQQNLGIRTALVAKGTLSVPVEAVGNIGYNEHDVAMVQARNNGYVERLHARAPFDTVRKGQALAELYVPEWIAAQEEYLSVKRMGAAGADLAPAARQRMRLVGMSEEQVGRVDTQGAVSARITLRAPISGIISELGAREGMTVSTGALLFRINGTDSVWVNAEVPENSAAAIIPGASVQVRTPALQGMVFQGKVGTILPDVNSATRTLKARIAIPNPGNRLVPGMFATITVTPREAAEVLLVPSEAVIRTGSRSVVMVAEGQGKFHSADVEVGREASGRTEIRNGLTQGQSVVVSGQFLIDSEASLKGTATRMSAMPASGPDKAPDAALHRGQGIVEQIDSDEITLSHGPIPTMKWGAMTMGFKPPAGPLPRDIVVGSKVTFTMRETGDGAYQLTTIARQPGSVK